MLGMVQWPLTSPAATLCCMCCGALSCSSIGPTYHRIKLSPVLFVAGSSVISYVARPAAKSPSVNSTRFTLLAPDDCSAKLMAPCDTSAHTVLIVNNTAPQVCHASP
jgi:hypothetical protein